jgi:hypothetical protein
MMPAVKVLSVLALLALAACDKPMPPAQQKLLDDRAVARVEAMNRAPPPLRPIKPQPVTPLTQTRGRALQPGCAFTPEATDAPVALLVGHAEMLIDGQVAIFAEDTGSGFFDEEIRSHYVGKGLTLSLAGTGRGDDRNKTRLTVSDPFGRVVYSSVGDVGCWMG